ncbi:tetratricopeptide repeat-containing sensor histidine kinase [Flavobacterium sp. 3HN19-14]|uniref:tetratricopeptide repeat-containing sensor histidine kinase n=1 Tax=Flavobacterium sp. 3HN19-14 TaxID=3448133 RepID=UPI003EE0DB3C
MRQAFTYSAFFLSVIIIFSCKKTNSSKLINEEKNHDSLSVFFDQANNFSLSETKRIEYISKALHILELQKNDSLNRINYFKLANRYFNNNKLAEYKKTTELIVKKADQVNDKVSQAKAYSYLTDYYIQIDNPDSAYYNNYKAESLYKKLSDKPNIIKTLLNKAIFQHNHSDYLGCEKTVFEMLHFLKFSNNDEMKYEANNLLGIVYGELSEYNLSIKYYNLALEIANHKNMPREYQLKASLFNNIGMLYVNQKKYEKANSQFELALEQSNLFNDRPNIYAMALDNLAYSRFKKGDFRNIEDDLFKSLRIRDSLNINQGIIINKLHLSEYYAELKDSVRAFKFAKETFDFANHLGEKRELLNILKQLSKVNPRKSFVYSTEFYRINDSLELKERQIRNKFARIEFETDEIITQKNQLVEQRKTIIYISLAIILLGVLIFIIRMQASKNRELRFVQEQQKANEEIYQLMLNQQNKIEEVRQLEKKRIAQELHDGVLGKLFGTRMNLGVLNNKDGEKAKSERVIYIDELQTLEQEIREISHDLNSEKMAVFNNFLLMVGNFIETQRKVCKAAITFSADETIEWNNVENMAKINFYRILQEAFQNINKHANAENVIVSFTINDNLLTLDIQDDGVGFNYAKKKKGIGLLNMKARITDSKGNMQIITAPGEGTLLKFDIPLYHTELVDVQ